MARSLIHRRDLQKRSANANAAPYSGIWPCNSSSVSCTRDCSQAFNIPSGNLINNAELQNIIAGLSTTSTSGSASMTQSTVTVTQSAITVTASATGDTGSHISIGEAAGAGIGSGVGVMLLIGGAAWFFLRGKGNRPQKSHTVALQEAQSYGQSFDSHEPTKRNIYDRQTNELP